MKPVFREDNIAKLKGLIEQVQNPGKEENIFEVVNGLEDSLKSFKDNKENQYLIFGSSVLVLGFAFYLIISTHASWPMMFIVVWIGAFLYYRVHEKGLVNESLLYKREISPNDPVPKMEYLVSGIDLKLGRKSVLKGFLSLILSSTVMMAHRIFVDSSVTLNMFLFIAAIIASYFFWDNFYKEDTRVLNDLKSDINQLKSKVLLGRYANKEE